MKKRLLTLSIAVLAVAALFAGNQTIKSINNETTKAMSSSVNEANNTTTVVSDSSAVLPSESDEAVKPVAAKDHSPAVPADQPTEEKKISAAEAEAIALKQAGFSASEVYDKEVELDYENGVRVYEVSFDKDRTDYDYVIDAVSGEVLYSKVDPEDKGNSKSESATNEKNDKPVAEAEKPSPSPSENKASESRITAKEAEAIALKKAGFSASEVYDKETELDYEKGILVYEVSFEKGNTDYEYIINAQSGEIVRSEIDPY